MEYEYISRIVSKLLEMTKEERILWNIDSKTQKHWKFSYQSLDKNNKFAVDLSLNDNLELNNHKMWWLYIYNKDLPDGKAAVYSQPHPSVITLVEELYRIYVKPSIKVTDQTDTLNKILNSLDLENIRDQKIGSII